MQFWRRFPKSVERLLTPAPLGRRGEEAAARYLKRRGYHVVARRERDALGELDLVAVDGRTVVFVEVKTRRGDTAGHPADAVDATKQRRLTRLALSYLKRNGLLNDNPARFDIVAVIWPRGERHPKIEHIKDAFEASGPRRMFA